MDVRGVGVTGQCEVSGVVYLCGTDSDECPSHGKFIWFCDPCHEAWRAANPNTSKAIGEYAQGKGTLTTIKAAKEKDRHCPHGHR